MSGFEQLRQELRAATERQVRTTERPRSAPASAGRPRRTWRWQLVALSTAVASALVAVIAALPNEAGRTLGPASVGLARAAERECARVGGTPVRSSRCLSALGAVADAWQVPGRGDVLYVRRWWGTSALYVGRDGRPGARPDEPGAFMVQRGAEQEVWIRPDASGESLQHGESAPRLASPADRASWIAAGRPKVASSRPATGDDLAMQGPGSARQTWRTGEHAPELFPVGETNDSEGRPVWSLTATRSESSPLIRSSWPRRCGASHGGSGSNSRANGGARSSSPIARPERDAAFTRTRRSWRSASCAIRSRRSRCEPLFCGCSPANPAIR